MWLIAQFNIQVEPKRVACVVSISLLIIILLLLLCMSVLFMGLPQSSTI